MTPLHVALGDRGYDIEIVDGPLAQPRAHLPFWERFLASVGGGQQIVLVTNTTLAPLYGTSLAAAWRRADRQVVTVTLPDGERHKNAETLARIHDAMLETRMDRATLVVALGGGVIGDMAGFAAATYQRGVRFVQLPTTLLAQVDSSVGGKTGINHRLGKNMIGAFHQPRGVVIDLATLATLADREFRAGLAEIVKYGASLDVEFFTWLEQAMPRLVAREPDALAYAIHRSCALKAMIVADDERESGRRALLNFGHTFGHAIEGATGYGTWLHGEAVAAGMVMAARLSTAVDGIDGIDDRDVERLVVLLGRAGLPVTPPRLARAVWRTWMAGDKKVDAGRIRFVLLTGLGSAHLTTVDDAVLDAVLDASLEELATSSGPAS